MKEETREKIQDKTPLLNHTIFTKELIRRSIIQEDVSEFELYLWDSIFQYLFILIGLVIMIMTNPVLAIEKADYYICW